jgi:hypothetical protein
MRRAPRRRSSRSRSGRGSRQRRTEETAGWWVFIPAQKVANRARRALRKAAELRNLGVEDYFIVQEEGQHRWALSLGVFRTEDAARAGSGCCGPRACAPRSSARARPWCRRCGCR